MRDILIMLAVGCIGATAAVNHYDLLGRRGSEMNSPMVYKNVDYAKTQKNEQQKVAPSLENRALAKRASGITDNVKAIVGKFSPKGYYFRSCTGGTTGCAEAAWMNRGQTPLTTYLDSANKHFIHTEKDGLYPNRSYSLYTAGASMSYLSGYSMVESPYNFNYPNRAYASFLPMISNYSADLTIDTLTGKIHAYSGSTNGVYLDAEALPTRLNPNTGDIYAAFLSVGTMRFDEYLSDPDYEMRASQTYKALRTASDRSAVFVGTNRSSDPSDENPQIYIGVRPPRGNSSSGWYVGSTLDNYIYDKRTIEIVAAGNSGKNLFADAYAVNAITVGALDPTTGAVTSISAKNKPKYCSSCDTYNKPEVYTYSNYYIDDYFRTYTSSSSTKTYYPYYSGTEAAAALAAGMVSNMLSYNDFYKWHPEVVKAVMVNKKIGERDEDGLKYRDLVFNQANIGDVHHSYYFIGNVNTLMKSYNDCPDGHCGTRKEIRFHFDGVDLASGSGSGLAPGFCAAISWLNSGTDVRNLHKLPQNFEIYGYSKNGTISIQRMDGLYASSASVNDNNLKRSPYKRICVYNNASNANFIIRIVLDEEDSRSENYGQMVLGLDIKPIYQW